MTTPSQAELNLCFAYDGATGILTRKFRAELPTKTNTRFAGRKAGFASKRGYVQVGLGKKLYLAHRLIWKMVYGDDPPQIDHADGDPGNNRLSNLRRATATENQANKRAKRGKDLPKGVVQTPHGRFHAQITIAKRTVYLGAFATPQAASAAYAAAASKQFGVFARSK